MQMISNESTGPSGNLALLEAKTENICGKQSTLKFSRALGPQN